MPQFTVTVGRDARIEMTARIEASSLEEAQSLAGSRYYRSPLDTEWEETDVRVYDDIETVKIAEENGVVHSWSSDDNEWSKHS